MGKSKYSKEILVGTIQNFYNTTGRAPSVKECLTNGLVSQNVYQKFFGKWEHALKQSGIPYKKKHKPIIVKCTQCTNQFYFLSSTLKHKKRKSRNVFCSQSCAATYNNTHKKHGTRCSKLEIAIQHALLNDYPNIHFDFNSKEAINSELDIYCKQLRFAVELNGIVHYEPIFGDDKHQKIVNNDRQKMIACYKHGIELAVIDTSQCKKFTKKSMLKYYQIVKELIDAVIHRLNYC